MKKIFIGKILLGLLVCLLTTAHASRINCHSTENWMAAIDDSWQIYRISLPGAHDSGYTSANYGDISPGKHQEGFGAAANYTTLADNFGDVQG